MNPPFSTYKTRPIRFLELWSNGPWRMKVYGIAYDRAEPAPVLISKAKSLATSQLLSVPSTLNHYGVGFLGIHQGKTGDFVFVDWCADENELHHHVYVSPGPGHDFTYVTPSGLSACVWDLRVLAFEREAWVQHVLKHASTPDYERYLAARLNEDI